MPKKPPFPLKKKTLGTKAKPFAGKETAAEEKAERGKTPPSKGKSACKGMKKGWG